MRTVEIPIARRRPAARRRTRAAACLAGVVVFTLGAVIVANGLRHIGTRGARVLHFRLASDALRRTVPETAVVPGGRGVERRPLLVFLHGKGENEDSQLNDAMFAALATLGDRAPDVAFANGGADSYWHDRADGAWATYVMADVIPAAVHRLHADPSRVAIGGLSMGGFGALDIARLHPHRFCAVGADSAALWLHGDDSAAGAFDNAQDFAHHNVIAYAARARDPYAGARLWLDVGLGDPFLVADTTLAHTLTARGVDVSLHVWPGRHGQSYWQTHWKEYLRFYADALARCRR